SFKEMILSSIEKIWFLVYDICSYLSILVKS
ncbi:MAG: hypothetical protein ACI936_003853, partial [Paraglaciecola sp.]